MAGRACRAFQSALTADRDTLDEVSVCLSRFNMPFPQGCCWIDAIVSLRGFAFLYTALGSFDLADAQSFERMRHERLEWFNPCLALTSRGHIILSQFRSFRVCSVPCSGIPSCQIPFVSCSNSNSKFKNHNNITLPDLP